MEPKNQIFPHHSDINHIGDAELSELIDYELLSKLDSLKSRGINNSLSEIYRGGVISMSKENRRRNPEWMSQSANSFREILYIQKVSNNKQVSIILAELFKKNHSEEDVKKYKNYLNNLYLFFSDVAHHFSGDSGHSKEYKIGENFSISASKLNKESYFKTVRLYKQYLKLLVLTAIEIHRKIDTYIDNENKDINAIKVLINSNPDSKSYFYTKVNNNWLTWLWKNSFFTHLKEASFNSERIYNDFAELDYLRRMAMEEPKTVAEIVRSIPVSISNELVAVYLFWIIDDLPANQIKQLVDKIFIEKWVNLIKNYRISGYDVKKTVEKLVQTNDSNSILTLAKSLLTIKSKDKFDKKVTYYRESPFVVHHLIDSGLLDALQIIGNTHIEKTLKIFNETLSEIIKLGDFDESKVFLYVDLLPLYDIDIFLSDFEIAKQDRSSPKDFLAFIALLKTLIEKSFRAKNTTRVSIRKLFLNIDALPLSRVAWRLRLFAMSQSPQFFKKELREAFFRLFEVENSFDIEGGPEYHHAIKKCFSYLTKADQQLFIRKTFQYFSEKVRNNPNESWLNITAWQILSSIKRYLTAKEIDSVKTTFGHECSDNYFPSPSISVQHSGFVSYKSPVSLETYTIPDIIKNLKNNWTPQKLIEQYRSDDFLKPRRAEGLGNELRTDIKKRTDEYLNHINEFLDIDNIDLQYLYYPLRGIEEMLREGGKLTIEQAKLLLGFFNNLIDKINISKAINDYGKDSEFLSRWTEANKVSTDILVYIIRDKIGNKTIRDFENVIVKLIEYWFSFSHSPSQEWVEQFPYELHGLAINSVRGKAYEVFVEFIRKRKTLTEDIKKLFKYALEDESYAVQFCIGRYLASFYYIDKNFIVDLLLQIFPYKTAELKEKFIAVWSGYLSNNLYIDLYDILENYYSFAISIESNPSGKTNSMYKTFDESLAIHLALAFVHTNLQIRDDLFLQFWNNKNVGRHHEFITYIGQYAITKDNVSEAWFIKNNISKDKLFQFWDWCLANITDPEILSGFGFWINPKKEVLNENMTIERFSKTLEKTEGKINWDYSFLQRLPIFAQKGPDETINAITYFLLDSNGKINTNRHWPYYYDQEIKVALQHIFQNGNELYKQKVFDLINSLIIAGGSVFWDLEEIINS
jgi:hypothetical protein